MKRKQWGIVFIIFSAFFFTLMSAFIRLSGDLPFVQKSFFRNLIAMLVAFVIIILKKEGISTTKPNIKYHLLRSTFGLFGVFCNFYAVDHLLLSDATILNKMSPFFMLIFSFLFLAEKITLLQISAITGAFIGSLFIIKPSFENASLLPAFIGFMGGVFAGAAYTTVRKLSLMGEKGSFTVFFFSTFSTIVTLPIMLSIYQPMSKNQLVYLLLAGLSAAGGQFSITFAYSFAPSREISVFDYTQVIFSAGLGFILFSQIPDFLSVVGYIVISTSAIIMFLSNKKEKV